MRILTGLLFLILLETCQMLGVAFGEEVADQLGSVISQSGGASSAGEIHATAVGSAITEGVELEISYPGFTQDGRGKNHIKSVSVGRPEAFEHEGIYIWRNQEGIWTVWAKIHPSTDFTGTINSPKPLKIMKTDPLLAVTAKNGLEIIIQTTDFSGSKAIQFKDTGSHLVFDLFVDGLRIPERIFLGDGGINPVLVPFRLGRRPVITSESMGAERMKKNFLPMQDTEAKNGSVTIPQANQSPPEFWERQSPP